MRAAEVSPRRWSVFGRRLVPPAVAVLWASSVPFVALAADSDRDTAALLPLVVSSVALAVLWWRYQRSLGLSSAALWVGALFDVLLLLLGAVTFFWFFWVFGLVLVSAALGVVLAVHAARERLGARDVTIAALLLLASAASAATATALGFPSADHWWMPTHVVFAVTVGAASAILPPAAREQRRRQSA